MDFPKVDTDQLADSPTMRELVERVGPKKMTADGLIVDIETNDPVVVVAKDNVTMLFFKTEEGRLIPFGKQKNLKSRLSARLTPDFKGFRAVNLGAQQKLAELAEKWAAKLLGEVAA